MDPIIASIALAAATFFNAALGEGGKRALSVAWDKLLATVRERKGESHPAPALLEQLRNEAGDAAKSASIQARLSPLQLGSDPDVCSAVESLSAVAAQQLQHGQTVNAQIVKGAAIVNGTQNNTFNE